MIHSIKRGPVRVLVFAFAVAALAGGAAWAAGRPDGGSAGTDKKGNPQPVQAYRSAPVTPYIFNGDVRDLPQRRQWQPGDPVKEVPRRRYFKPGHKPVDTPIYEGTDRLLALAAQAVRSSADRAFEMPERNFDGIPFTGANPPDTSGEIGPNHYIQTTNGGGTNVRIYDKALPTPNLLASFNLDSLSTGGSCASGLGDPIVLYDRDADRWILTEFSSGGNNLCYYVSQTPDPVSGGWFAYGFAKPSFPDYPKYGVWSTDANGGQGSIIATSNETSSGVYAYDRGAMLNGDPTTFQRFTIADLPGFSFNAVTPADHDGVEAPVSGAPAVIMRQRDTEVHSGPAAPEDVLEIWHFDVDWVNESNTTLTQLADIDVAEFSSELCGLTAFACFEQPGTGTTLDPLREVIMNRLQYRNFGDYEVLVGNFVTDVDGTERGGVRWFELRRTGGISAPWTLFQEGLVSPDSDSRFMAASAMDQSGNIAVAYNVTSDTTFPSLRYSGRLADDPAGTMPFGETSIIEGSGSNSSNRYGDYSAMGVDPADDCTFWFTGMYNTSGNWSTRIASFRFEACGCDLAPNALGAAGSNNGDNRVDLTWNDSELDTVAEYRIQRGTSPGGPYTTIATVPDSSPGIPNGAGYSFSDETVSGGITYYYVVTASDGAACRSDNSNEVSVTATGICLLAPTFDGASFVATTNQLQCELSVNWDPANAPCGGNLVYDVFRSDSSPFEPSPANQVAEGVTGTSYVDNDQLVNGQAAFYIVRARDAANGVSETNSTIASGAPLGVLTSPGFFDDGGDTTAAQLTSTAPWSLSPTGGNNGPGAYTTGSYGNDTCAALTTPEIALPPNSFLQFWSRYEIEDNWDKGEVQISTDDGATWTRVEADYPLVANQAADECGFPSGQGYFSGTNNEWQQYSADLSAFAGQNVRLRFAMSSDGSVVESGWWIDDIAVGPLADVCQTASSCADNPLVDVTPNGNLTTCSLTLPELSVNTIGGAGNFSYQWLRDGQPIAGANGTTFQPTGSGTYNVEVQADGCDVPIRDGAATAVTAISDPTFTGLTDVANSGSTTCGIDVAWADATGICPGPIVYNVYRSTTSDVQPTVDNLVAAQVSGNALNDSIGLTSGGTYFYVVEAVDLSTGGSALSAVELSALVEGPATVSYSDDGGDTTPADLLVTAPWTNELTGGNGGGGFYTTGAYDNNVCADVRTSAFTVDPGADLKFSTTHEIEPGWDKGEVQVSTDSGSTWQRLELDYPNTSTATQDADACEFPPSTSFFSGNADWTEYTADLSAFVGESIIVRFEFSTDASVTRTGGWSIDDISVEAPQACATAAAGPPPAPDGRNGTAPLRGDRVTLNGDTIDLIWDTASCTADEYNLLFGDLANVATTQLTSGVCELGTTGQFTWPNVPQGDLFFLIVGASSAGEESSWGVNSDGVERNGNADSSLCLVTSKNATGTCPSN